MFWDLHWADPSTIDWIAAFAARADPARVLVIGTFRPADIHPSLQALSTVVERLRLKGGCREIALSGLDEAPFAAFVSSRHPPAHGAEARLLQLASLVRSHTDGNPLFASLVLEDLVGRGVLVDERGGWSIEGEPTQVILGIPDDVRRVIERQLERLEARSCEILRVASVVGAEGSVLRWRRAPARPLPMSRRRWPVWRDRTSSSPIRAQRRGPTERSRPVSPFCIRCTAKCCPQRCRVPAVRRSTRGSACGSRPLTSIERQTALYVKEQHFPLAASYGNHDAAVCARAFDGRALALLGDITAAHRAVEAAVALARHLGHPFTLALALVFAAAVHQFCGDPTATARYGGEAVTLCREHSFPLVLAWAMTFEGWAEAVSGAGEAALSKIDEGLARAQATGSDQFRTHFLGLAADARLHGRTPNPMASAWIREGFSVAGRTGERFFEAELHRLDGEAGLLDPAGTHEAAEAAFERALAVAREQGAKLFLLRGAVRLARLRRDRSGALSMRTMLQEASAGVIGGHDLPDVRDALQLLHEAGAQT